MTGLNLESFLHLLRADFGAWATLGLIAAILAVMTWTSWGSRRALRKCLVLSVMAHCGLALYGGSFPVGLLATRPNDPDRTEPGRLRSIKVAPWTEPTGGATEPSARNGRSGDGGRVGASKREAWDRISGGLALADAKLFGPKTALPAAEFVKRTQPTSIGASPATPETNPPAPPSPEGRPETSTTQSEPPPTPSAVTPAGRDEVAPVVVGPRVDMGESGDLRSGRLNGERTRTAGVGTPAATPRLPLTLPDQSATPRLLASASEAGPLVERKGDARPAENVVAAPAARPTAASDGDVARPEVIAARPESPKLSVGNSSLRPQARPAGPRATAGAAAATSRSVPPPTLALAPPLTAPAAGEGNGTGLAERPVAALSTPAEPGAEGSGIGRVPGNNRGMTAAAAGADEVRAPVVARAPAQAAVPETRPESDVRRRSRPDQAAAPTRRERPTAPDATAPLAIARVVPNGVPALPEIQGATGGRPLADVPEVYRSRLDPNRSALAYRAGASPASEQAVERALDWLSRHQDDDGRWDAATAKYDDGTAVQGDDDFTVHCPAGETCFGECVYWEADTALTGLALLAYLGAGYTQTDGKYAETVGKGLEYLRSVQKPDGDLRGKSRAVGMYCHAMATIALCEAYALTGDERLRGPVERAVGFLGRSRARDNMAWRYSPGAPVGDTSILGWVVMALKSAREVGIEVPSTLQAGTLGWLNVVSSGQARGLARYQPADPVTPTMTAEAWVCRQFLGVGGPGPASTEAAAFLLNHGPKVDAYNLYYWYYGTLAMYQHGGAAWTRWNSQVRDEIVRRQRKAGHTAGSWDPDDSPYGSKGGRIYCTSLATLSLEVYYRYLRLYDEPNIPPAVAPSRPRTLGQR
ncbi:MAG: hypothetical protein U0835_05945 [Isosphaeraceae bacterium]